MRIQTHRKFLYGEVEDAMFTGAKMQPHTRQPWLLLPLLLHRRTSITWMQNCHHTMRTKARNQRQVPRQGSSQSTHRILLLETMRNLHLVRRPVYLFRPISEEFRACLQTLFCNYYMN